MTDILWCTAQTFRKHHKASLITAHTMMTNTATHSLPTDTLFFSPLIGQRCLGGSTNSQYRKKVPCVSPLVSSSTPMLHVLFNMCITETDAVKYQPGVHQTSRSARSTPLSQSERKPKISAPFSTLVLAFKVLSCRNCTLEKQQSKYIQHSCAGKQVTTAVRGNSKWCSLVRNSWSHLVVVPRLDANRNLAL